jgi:beta-glucosidase-like glycosyl hydrolase
MKKEIPESPLDVTERHGKMEWKRAKQRLRRNIRLRLKAGKFEELRKEPKIGNS